MIAAWAHLVLLIFLCGSHDLPTGSSSKKVPKCDSDELLGHCVCLSGSLSSPSAAPSSRGRSIYQSESTEYVLNWQEAQRRRMVVVAESVAVQTGSRLLIALRALWSHGSLSLRLDECTHLFSGVSIKSTVSIFFFLLFHVK